MEFAASTAIGAVILVPSAVGIAIALAVAISTGVAIPVSFPFCFASGAGSGNEIEHAWRCQLRKRRQYPDEHQDSSYCAAAKTPPLVFTV
jgi:hypothetical protein